VSEKPTPETDAEMVMCDCGVDYVPVALARALERERDHWKEQSQKWCDDFTKLEPELRRVVELAKQCKAERDEAREALRKAVELLDEVIRLHRDPDAAEYNECDKEGEECLWCVDAKKIRAILEAKP
jgi:uncharacterized coiled-coil DUF342 family protein